MYKSDSYEYSYMKQCMTNTFAETSMGFWLDDYYFNVECSQREEDDGYMKGGAKALAVSSALMALVLTSLY